MDRAFCFDCTFGTMQTEPETKGYCYVFKRSFNAEQLSFRWQCEYFIKTIYEDGIPMTEHQHLLLKQNELDAKK